MCHYEANDEHRESMRGFREKSFVGRRSGGWRQQQAALAESHARSRSPVVVDGTREPHIDCPLLDGLLSEWAWGDMSAPRLRQHCSNALASGLDNAKGQAISDLGAEG